jgi:hypothetical protein
MASHSELTTAFTDKDSLRGEEFMDVIFDLSLLLSEFLSKLIRPFSIEPEAISLLAINNYPDSMFNRTT